MNYTKKTQALVNERLAKPFSVGDTITFTGEGNGSKDLTLTSMGEIVEIKGTKAIIAPLRSTRNKIERDFSEITQSIYDVGADPIGKRRLYQKYAIEIRSLLRRLGYDNHGVVGELPTH